MCTLCSVTRTFDPARHKDGVAPIFAPDLAPGLAPEFALVAETSDALAGLGAQYEMMVGDTFTGQVDHSGDADWVAITLTAGTTYDIGLSGGTLDDTQLAVQNAQGEMVAFNDDIDFGGGNYDSGLNFTATQSGTYFLQASAWGSLTGSYSLSVTQAPTQLALPPMGTLDQMADYLTSGYWGAERRWDMSQDNVITVDITRLTAEGQQLARWAFEAWEAVIDVDFAEVQTGANITFDDNQSGAFASSSYNGQGYFTSSEINVSLAWLQGQPASVASYAFGTYIHEIGHALGLGHQGNYNGQATYARDAVFMNDSYQLSIMSYFSQTENPHVVASYANPVTAMMVDIVALQNHYGTPDAASSSSAGNTVWGLNGTTGTYMEQLFAAYQAGQAVAGTLYDVGGHDRLDLSFLSEAANLDMRPEGISDIAGETGNLMIARGTQIEDLTLGAGNDTVRANDLSNTIVTGAGHDLVTDDGGWDGIWLGAGNDTAYGGRGNDRIGGDTGHDQLWGGTGDDTIWGGGWSDTLGGGAGDDRLSGDAGSDTLWGGDGHDTLMGGLHDDQLGAGAGHDLLQGGDGRDRLSGGAGRDTLEGGASHDLLNGGGWSDVLSGGAGHDTLAGDAGHDTLSGGAGDDVFWLGQGNDQATGDAGADVFVFNSGCGHDQIRDFTLAQGDVLRLDDALWAAQGTLSAADMLDQFTSQTAGGDLLLSFDDAHSLLLQGIGSLVGLETAVEIF
jgi:serralysin